MKRSNRWLNTSVFFVLRVLYVLHGDGNYLIKRLVVPDNSPLVVERRTAVRPNFLGPQRRLGKFNFLPVPSA